jgi:hypothetical protein
MSAIELGNGKEEIMTYAKHFLIGAMLLAVTASQSFAGFRLPNYIYRINRLEQAQSKAKADKKPLTFVYTNKSTK